MGLRERWLYNYAFLTALLTKKSDYFSICMQGVVSNTSTVEVIIVPNVGNTTTHHR